MQVTRIIKQIGLVLLKDEVYLLDDVIMSSFLNTTFITVVMFVFSYFRK